jgi:hypothetical protein
VRYVGDDLQRVAVAADAIVVELRLDARLVDEILGGAAAEHHRRGARVADDEVGRLDDVADDVDQAGAGVTMARLRQPHPDRRVGDGGAEDRDVGAVGRGQDPLLSRLLPQVFAELVEELARRVRPPLEREREGGDPLVVVAELVLLRVGVVDAVDALRLQRRIVLARRPDVVMTPAGLVQVMVEVGAGRDETVDVAVGDEVRDDQPQPAGAERARHAEEDRAVVAEHLLPDAPRGGEVPPLKRNALHAFQEIVRRGVGRHDERLDWSAKKT